MRVPAAPDGAQPDAPISDYYAKVPRSVLTDPRLSDRAVRLWALLDSHLVGKPYTIKVATLADEMGATVRSTERALSELVALGYVTRSRTRSVSVTAVNNPLRSAKSGKRSATAVGSDPTQVADTSRTTPLRTINNKPRETPARSSAVAPTATDDGARRDRAALQPYLDAINATTGAGINWSPHTRARLVAVSATGETPEGVAALVTAFIQARSTTSPVYSVAGFVLDAVLPAIAQGQSAPRELPAQPTPVPPTYQELLEQPVCEHGAEQGRCALCRRMAHTAPQHQEMPV